MTVKEHFLRPAHNGQFQDFRLVKLKLGLTTDFIYLFSKHSPSTVDPSSYPRDDLLLRAPGHAGVSRLHGRTLLESRVGELKERSAHMRLKPMIKRDLFSLAHQLCNVQQRQEIRRQRCKQLAISAARFGSRHQFASVLSARLSST
ncbi:hypothetical protein J6590_067071 [Homalodisca vitripennis]|nr:hypothetical protein J6590_067071 [Homalodisca vitripennis]